MAMIQCDINGEILSIDSNRSILVDYGRTMTTRIQSVRDVATEEESFFDRSATQPLTSKIPRTKLNTRIDRNAEIAN